MKTISHFKKKSQAKPASFNLQVKGTLCAVLIITITQSSLLAQAVITPTVGPEPQYSKPSWWFGAAAGANFNFYNGSTQKLNSDLTPPVAFKQGNGVGLYLGPLVEYYSPGSQWGVMLQAGYDNRNGKYKEVTTPCNCPADLSTKLSYIAIEPSVRFAPFKSDFYLYAGPRVAFNIKKEFTYELKTNPAYPEQPANPVVTGELSDVNDVLVSMQIGAGYDIPVSKQNMKTQFVISPFVSFHPYFGQDPRSIETWNITTLRAGAAFKFGCGQKVLPGDIINGDSKVRFSVIAPENTQSARRVREIFPLRNYVFFDIGSTEIPDRYVLLRKSQVKDFKEDQAQGFKPKKISARAESQMIVYYNVLNILGDRMVKNPGTKITLVGSSEKGPNDGELMAQAIKNYLVDVFVIDGSRITIEGRDKPLVPSERPDGKEELGLLREGDRRVSIESNSPVLLMEYQTGPGTPLKPVEIVKEAPLDSYVTLNASLGNAAFSTWSVEFKDETGKVQNFGPYKTESVNLPGKSILGTKPEGDYKITLTGLDKNGNTLKKETNAHIVLWKQGKVEEVMRFSVIFEFNESKTVALYEKYLAEVVTPKIPKGGTVVIHGHTDIIGEPEYNKKLSLDRANEVRDIIKNALVKAGRTDVKFDVTGFGENQTSAPFDNDYPEERAYNRTVVIDIIPAG